MIESQPRRPLALFILLILFVAAATAMVHWPALASRALCFDDRQYVINNRLVKNPSWPAAWTFLSEVTNPSTVGGYYQPLAMISLMLDTALGGRSDNLRPYHRTSLALHVANTCLLAIFLYLLLRQPFPAVAVALLFGLHPLTVEPIPWLGERKTLLSTFFSLLALCAYIEHVHLAIPPATRTPEPLNPRTAHRLGSWFTASLVFFLLALLSKPTSTPLPLVMLLLDVWPLKRFSRRAIIEKAPFLALAGASAIITYVSQRNTAGTRLPTPHSLSQIILTICHNIVFYPCKFLWPSNLTPHYEFPSPMSLANPTLVAAVIVATSLLIIIALSLRWTPAWLIGSAAFFVAIFPTLGVIGFTNVIASDKYAYLPAIGFALPLTWLLSRVVLPRHDSLPSGRGRPGWRRPSARAIAFIALGIIFVLESSATRAQYEKWRDSVTLFTDMVERAPQSGIVHDELGSALADLDRLPEAAAQFEIALRQTPNIDFVHNNYGTVLRALGRVDEAIAHYRRAIALNPRYLDPRINLANALRQQARLEDAIHEYRAVLAINPRSFHAKLFLGTAFYEKGDFPAAIEHLRQAISLDPSFADGHYFLGMALESAGRTDEAMSAYEEALRRRPHDPKIEQRLAGLRAPQKNLTTDFAD